MKIGIGITTTPARKDIFELCRRQVDKYSKGCEVVIVEDDRRRGVAHSKNRCLTSLAACDYIFLLDDDCFPLNNRWIPAHIEAHKKTGNHHFMYLTDTPSIFKLGEREGIGRYNNCAGCFMFLTREVIEKVGGFCKDYGRYGFEHAGYSHRIHKAGLTPWGGYLSLNERTVYSLDLDCDMYWGVEVKPNVPPAGMEKLINENKKIYQREKDIVYQPLG